VSAAAIRAVPPLFGVTRIGVTRNCPTPATSEAGGGSVAAGSVLVTATVPVHAVARLSNGPPPSR
jgi:hypothetical protein